MTGALHCCIPRNKNRTSLSSVCLAATYSEYFLPSVSTHRPAHRGLGLVRTLLRFCKIKVLKLFFELTWFEPCVGFWRTVTTDLTDVFPQRHGATNTNTATLIKMCTEMIVWTAQLDTRPRFSSRMWLSVKVETSQKIFAELCFTERKNCVFNCKAATE